MAVAYVICVGYALFGVLYMPGWATCLTLGFVALSASPLLLTWRSTRAECAAPHPPVGLLAFGLMFSLGLLNVLLIARSLGQGLGDLLSLEGFIETASAATSRRYEEGGASGNALLMVTSIFLVYRTAAAGASMRWWTKILAFVPMLLYTLVSTEKWPMFVTGMFFFLGIFAEAPAWPALRRASKVALLFGALGAAMGSVALVLRGFAGDPADLLAMLLHYVLAPFPAFGSWYGTRAPDMCCSGGLLTFIGPADQLGFIKRESGVFADNAIVYGVETNIYTAWRYLVQDFGDLGPLALCLLLAVAQLACEELLEWPVVARALRTFTLFSALVSSNVTPFVHNSVGLAAILAVTYSAFVQWRRAGRYQPLSDEQARTRRLQPRQGQSPAQAADR